MENCGELIKGQLNSLESIKFENCCIHDIHSAFLKHSPELKQIMIKEARNQNNSVMEWTKYHYPQLKSFMYHSHNMIIKNVEQFFMLNPQITNVNCSSTEIFRLLFRKALNLDFLYLSFTGCEFQYIANELQAYCDQGHVKRLELHSHQSYLSRHHFEEVVKLATIPALLGLHFKGIPYKADFAAALAKFEHLTVASLCIDHISPKQLEVLSRKLTKLKELHLELLWSKTIGGNKFKPFIQTFAMNAPNLKLISIRGLKNNQLITGNDIVTLHRIRKETPNASILTIYLDYKIIEECNFIIPAHSLVLVKPLSQLQPDYRKIY